MNKYIQQFLDDNDLKIDEEFFLEGFNPDYRYFFADDGKLNFKTNNNVYGYNSAELARLLDGQLTIIKIKDKLWKPKFDEGYWFVSQYGHVNYNYNDNGEDDKYILTHRPVFQTEEEAKDYKWFLDKVDEYKKPFKTRTENYFIYYNHDAKEICEHYAYYHQTQGTIYFGNKENIDKFLEEVGEDRINRYWFNIWE